MNVVYSPREIFLTAEQFRAAYRLLYDQLQEERFGTIWPMAICSAFATELYLKGLILLETDLPARGHDLRELFYQLSPDSQEAIRARFRILSVGWNAALEEFCKQTGNSKPATDFDEVLEMSRRAFEALRYHYESTVRDNEGWSAVYLKEAIRDRIMELEPSWRSC